MRRQIKIRGKDNIKKQTPTSSKLNASVQMNKPASKAGQGYSTISETREIFYERNKARGFETSQRKN